MRRPKGVTTLKGLRLGVLTSYINHTIDETSPEVSTLFEKSLAKFKPAGVHLIFLDEPSFHPQKLSKAEVLLHELHQSLNAYLSQPSHKTCPPLSAILTSPLIDPIAVGPTWPQAFNLSTSDPDYSIRLARIEYLKLLFAKLFADNELDAMIYPHQTVLVAKVGAAVQSGRNGLLTSLTGTPGAVVPMGMSTRSESAKDGVPAGMEVVGLWGSDWKILGIAKEIEQLLNGRRKPTLG
jgi:Asp-tRNA(Asn)/Glu-tRNA(Gln) amidotransferase A subunit family amidase